MTRHQGTGDHGVVTDLAEMLRTLCQVPGAAAIALLGTPRPSEISEHFVRIEPIRFPAFRAIELRPWTNEEFGVALPELADPAEWSLFELANMFGPLQEGPRLQGRGLQFQGFFDDPALPARAAVYVILEADDPLSAIEQVRIRIESMDRK